ncbi:hypothetical protein VP01_4555g1 [Puccinia sorghi]|uniref:Uncharacterized protein n=1 Tax=Puccinia sorghi TaxID=27349 RepID=A0A0L6UQR0_9BASI|nr:hypothetical protein VP01_4555g1 [Puccinia sorghi]
MPTQSTQSPSVITAGHASNVSEGRNRQTSQASQSMSSPTIQQKTKECCLGIKNSTHRFQKEGKEVCKEPTHLFSSKLGSQLIPVKHKCQFKNFFFEPYCCKGDLRINSNFFLVGKPYNKPPTASQIFGPILMTLVKLQGYKMASQNFKKPLKRVPSFLPIFCRKLKQRKIQKKDHYIFSSSKQKSLITKLSIASYISFHCCEPGLELFKQKWAATSGCVIYLDLQEAMLNFFGTHFISKGHQKQFQLHDIWTTKGNPFGFIDALVSFINNYWNYIVKHLSLKLVAWNHKGSLLAEPIVNVLAKHDLQRKISINSLLFTKNSNNITDLYCNICQNINLSQCACWLLCSSGLHVQHVSSFFPHLHKKPVCKLHKHKSLSSSKTSTSVTVEVILLPDSSV